jgi:hypothetical protein
MYCCCPLMPTLQMTAVELFFAASQQPTLLLHLPSTADLKLLLRAFKGCKEPLLMLLGALKGKTSLCAHQQFKLYSAMCKQLQLLPSYFRRLESFSFSL